MGTGILTVESKEEHKHRHLHRLQLVTRHRRKCNSKRKVRGDKKERGQKQEEEIPVDWNFK